MDIGILGFCYFNCRLSALCGVRSSCYKRRSNKTDTHVILRHSKDAILRKDVVLNTSVRNHLMKVSSNNLVWSNVIIIITIPLQIHSHGSRAVLFNNAAG